MKLCYVSFEFPPQFGGGIGTYVANATRNLALAGHEIHVVTFNPADLPNEEIVNGITIHRIKMQGPEMELINNAGAPNLSTLLYWSHYSEKVYWKLKELNNKISFNVVEFCDYRGEGYFSMLAKKTRGEFMRTSLIVRLHTPLFVLNKYNNAIDDPGMEQLVQFENFSMLLCDCIVSPTNVLAQLTKDELGLTEDIDVVPHPIDLHDIPFEEYTESNTLLYVGRLENRKGVVDLIHALAALLPKHPHLSAKLIGGDTNTGPNGSSMKAYLKSLIPAELVSKINFIDPLPRQEILQEYRKSMISIFPSRFENFPNVCLEAMASGVPVVAGHFSGMAEMIEDQVSGFIFEAGNIPNLVEKLDKVIALPFHQRADVGKKARARIENAYSIDVNNKEQIDYFEKISLGFSLKKSKFKYNKGQISVVIPCYNHGKYIEETIQSVENNTYTNVEIIVVDDGSTDPDTILILDQLSGSNRIRFVRQQNAGLSAARNTGVNHAKGEFILPLDADDTIDSRFLEKTIAPMIADDGIGFVYTYVQFFGAASGVWQTPEFDPNLILISNLCVASSLFRHEAFDRIGGYKEDMTQGFEDWDFWIYMVENGWRGKCIQEPLFNYRKHEESMLSNSQKHRSVLISKLVEHHFASYSKSLSYVVVEKDRMFFNEHMSNYLNYSELNSIKNSKAWKLVTLLRKVKDRVRSLTGGKR